MNVCFSRLEHQELEESAGKMKRDISNQFSERHIGSNEADIQSMLAAVSCKSLEELVAKIIPESIRFKSALAIPSALSEADVLQTIGRLASRNKLFKSYIGQGYSDNYTPPRNSKKHFRKPRLVYSVYSLSA